LFNILQFRYFNSCACYKCLNSCYYLSLWCHFTSEIIKFE